LQRLQKKLEIEYWGSQPAVKLPWQCDLFKEAEAVLIDCVPILWLFLLQSLLYPQCLSGNRVLSGKRSFVANLESDFLNRQDNSVLWVPSKNHME
jgi:hypothetical protein